MPKIKLPIHIHCGDGIGYFGVFGFGLAWKNLKKHRLYFSERNGIIKTFRIRDILFALPLPFR